MKNLFWLPIACVLLFANCKAEKEDIIEDAAQENIQPITIGESITIESAIMGEPRKLNVYLPNGYADSTKQYPVIYLLDGAMDQDFLHVAGITQFGSFPWLNMVKESIVVGIENTDRSRDMTYATEDEEMLEIVPNAGNANNFIAHIGDEIIPFIEKRYRAGEENTLIGQSFGALLASQLVLKKPEYFDNYMIVSPSLWWDNESLLDWELPSDYAGKTIHIAVGKEGEVMERVARKLHEKLKPSKATLSFQYLPERDHANILHQAVYDGLGYVWPSE